MVKKFVFLVAVFVLLAGMILINIRSVCLKPEITAGETGNSVYLQVSKEIDTLLYSDKTDYKKALKLINTLLSKPSSLNDEQIANLKFRKSEIHLFEDKPELAEKELKSALLLNLNPDQKVYVLSCLAGICSISGRRKDAIDYIQEAGELFLEMNPNDDFFGAFEFHYNRGIILFDLGEYSEAAVELKKALKKQPGNDQIMIELATALFRSNRFDEAGSMADRWFKHNYTVKECDRSGNISDGDIAENIVKYYIIKGKYEKALEMADISDKESKSVCNMDPERACAYYCWEKYDEAEVVLKRMINSEHYDFWEKENYKNLLQKISMEKQKKNVAHEDFGE